MTKKTTTYLLRDLDVTFWSSVKAKAAREQISVKGLLVKLLAKWLGAGCLVIAMTGCGDGSQMGPTPLPRHKVSLIPKCTQIDATQTAANYTCINEFGQIVPVACAIEGNAITCQTALVTFH